MLENTVLESNWNDAIDGMLINLTDEIDQLEQASELPFDAPYRIESDPYANQNKEPTR